MTELILLIGFARSIIILTFFLHGFLSCPYCNRCEGTGIKIDNTAGELGLDIFKGAKYSTRQVPKKPEEQKKRKSNHRQEANNAIFIK